MIAGGQGDMRHGTLPGAEIRRLAESDLPQVARIHTAAFPESALTRLGVEAVRRYYAWQMEGPHEIIALGCTSDGELAGFCFAGVFRGAMSGFLRKNKVYLAGRVLTHPWLALNPLIRERARLSLRLLRRGRARQAASPAPVQASRETFGVLAIAVHPSRQGKGLGSLMMGVVEAHARNLGYSQINLSVNGANQQAIQFYEGSGWRKASTGEGWNGEMVKDIR